MSPPPRRAIQGAAKTKLREAVRLAVRRCAADWTGKKPVVARHAGPGLTDAVDVDPGDLCAVLAPAPCSSSCRSACARRKKPAPKVEPGHAESAPHGFSFGRVALRATILAAILFGIFYANYAFGWITAEDLDWAR